MNSPTITAIKTLSLEDAVREKVDALTVGQTITVKDITESLRKDVNASRLTLLNVDFNSNLASKFYLHDGSFERQTVTYEAVKDAFLKVIGADPTISWSLDSTNTFRIYRRGAVTGQTLSPTTTQTWTAPPAAATVVSSTPQLNPIKVRSLAERALDGSITHTYTVELNGEALVFNKRSIFISRTEAMLAVEDRLRDVLGLSDKELAREIKSLVREGVLEFVRRKV